MTTLEELKPTQLELATLNALRDRAGWWVGDTAAIKVLRQFAQASIRDVEKQETNHP